MTCCGAGQVCIIAVKEFHVKSAVGIDAHRGRIKLARENVRRERLRDIIKIKHGYIQDANLKHATLVYYGLEEQEEMLEVFEKKLQTGFKLITLSVPLVGVISNKEDFPFFLSSLPFKRAKTLEEWAREAVLTPANFLELKSKLKSDPDYRYKLRLLSKLLKLRFGREPKT